MKFAIVVFVLICIFVVQVKAQNHEEKLPRELQRLETSWLTANLNNDVEWLRRFSAQKLNVQPSANTAVEDRAGAVNNLTSTSLQPNEMKVRISGTISLLTNDPAQNRSYYFLDTFNKIGGKWQVIASSISLTAAPQPNGREQSEKELLKLENEWARAEAADDGSVLHKILSPAFLGTSEAGMVRGRREWIDASQRESLRRATKSEMRVRVLNDSLAIVTGVQTAAGPEKDGREIAHADRFTDTWSKNSEGQWQCVASHVTRLHAGQKQNYPD